MNEYKTPKGTALPLMNIKGKPYLQVAYRIVWFREEHPNWSITTEVTSFNSTSSTVKAIISDPSGLILSTAHKSEDKQGFFDFLEKAETGAIGRALANLGYGTQFCADELDEGTRLADSPLQPVKPSVAHRNEENLSNPSKANTDAYKAKETTKDDGEKVEPINFHVQINNTEHLVVPGDLQKLQLLINDKSRPNQWSGKLVKEYMQKKWDVKRLGELTKIQFNELYSIVESLYPSAAMEILNGTMHPDAGFNFDPNFDKNINLISGFNSEGALNG